MTIRPLVIASNMFNEIESLPRWFDCFEQIADGGLLIVDSGSNDGSIEYAKDRGAIVIVDDIIRREGYGPARNQLRVKSKEFYPEAHWMAYFDADETIDEKEFHQFRYIKDYLNERYDVVAFPRIDWYDLEKKKSANNYRIMPDWQARMTRLNNPIGYIRKLHEQVAGHRAIYARLTTPKINHFHRSTAQEKRDLIGKLCAKLHMEDTEWGHTVGMHPKEQYYRELYEKEGL